MNCPHGDKKTGMICLIIVCIIVVFIWAPCFHVPIVKDHTICSPMMVTNNINIFNDAMNIYKVFPCSYIFKIIIAKNTFIFQINCHCLLWCQNRWSCFNSIIFFSKVWRCFLGNHFNNRINSYNFCRSFPIIFKYYRDNALFSNLKLFNLCPIKINPSPLIQLHRTAHDIPLESRENSVYKCYDKNSCQNTIVGALIRCMSIVLGLLFLFLSYHFAYVCVNNFPMRIFISIWYLLLSAGLVWIGMFHVLFGFWYLN